LTCRGTDLFLHFGLVDAPTIDRINILQATIRAMHKALEGLDPSPDYVLVDGRPISHPQLPVQGIINGDSLCYAIAAASIIAKETRDRLMEDYHQRWPHYGFDQHKGYGTRAHVAALRRHGPCPIHRRSFNPVGQLRSCLP
jgi:ribonuclease HII